MTIAIEKNKLKWKNIKGTCSHIKGKKQTLSSFLSACQLPSSESTQSVRPLPYRLPGRSSRRARPSTAPE